MITPSYSATATERVLPRLALDFTTGVLDPRVTVTRALNTATRVNSSGYIETVNADLPRFDYNPATLAARGLLIEESRANLLVRSSELATSPWTTNQTTVSADATTSPDGTLNADKVIPSTVSGAHNLYQSYTYTAAAHALSIYAKPAGYNWIRLGSMFTGQGVFFDVANGVVGTVSAGYTGTIEAAGDGWYRCTVTRTATAGADLPGFYVSNSGSTVSFVGDGTSGVFAWGAQLEIGAFATSYIPTTTTSLTRNADVVQMTGTNFSSWYNVSQGTFMVETDSAAATANQTKAVLIASDGTTSNRAYMFVSTTAAPSFLVTSNNASQASMAASTTVANNTVFKIIAAYKQDSFAVTANSVSPVEDTAGNVPLSPNQLSIGYSPAGSPNQINGRIKTVLYWPQRVTNAETRAFSK